jgi:hypothetical protein
LEYWLFPNGLTYLGFVLRENLLLYSSKPSLGVPNWPVIYFINYTPTSSLALFITAPSTSFLAPLPGRKKKTSARGISHAHPLLCFKFCFTLFLLASFYQKQKKIVSFIVVFRDFYFRALGSLVVLSFPQPLNFFSVFPSL